MRNARMLLRALGVERAVVENVAWSGVEGTRGDLVVRLRAAATEPGRC